MKIFFSLVFTLSLSAHAAPEIISVSGVSGYDNTTGTTPIIYAGTAGNISDCDTSDNNSTCNTCTTAQTNCNTRRIFTSLRVKIQFKDTAITGSPLVTTASNAKILLDTGSSGSVSAGNTLTAYILWSSLCGSLSGTDSTCATAISDSIQVGVSTDGSSFTGTTSQQISIILSKGDAATAPNTVAECGTNPTSGICGFNVYPGDGKVYLESPQAKGSFPTIDNTQFEYVRVYHSDQNFAAINHLTSSTDLKVEAGDSSTTPELTNKTIEGLTNETLYYFRIALVDRAGNISHLTADSAYASDSNCGTPPADDNAAFLCPFTAKPQKVFGLLEDDFNCFITTAAYGSGFEPKVMDFKQFRRRFLLPHKWGRQLNQLYYKYGPHIAKKIAFNENLKAATRFALYPFWVFAKGSLMFGFGNMVIVLFALFLIPLLYFRNSQLKRKLS